MNHGVRVGEGGVIIDDGMVEVMRPLMVCNGCC